ncbi:MULTISPECIES: MFS transporter [unclassified Microbacterium]|uniref:MFS transporter n=1 Tax=unclassified Microbacterium TaxID=2609290 RepID=UPI00301A4448
MTTTAPTPVIRDAPPMRYGALIAMMLLSFLLVTAEFLPNGVLIEMADSLGVTPGQAGQTVTVTALVGFVVAPTIGLIVPRMDRRLLLVWMAVAAAVSSVVAGIAPSLPLILLSRALLGMAISAFWAMSITVAARLAGPDRLGRAVMFTSAGVSLATVAGVPVGVLLSEILDWRAVFVLTGILTGLLAIVLRIALPSVPADRAASLRVLADAARRPGVGLGLAGHVLIVLGHFLAYTYIRVALDRVPEVRPDQIVLLLALFGVGGLIGNLVIGLLVDRSFGPLSVIAPLAIAAAITATALLPGSIVAVGVAVVVWGFFFASWLIVINTWVGHRLPDRLEAGGSLVVTGFQGAITLAAATGGVLIDTMGVGAVDGIGVALLVVGATLFAVAGRRRQAGIASDSAPR